MQTRKNESWDPPFFSLINKDFSNFTVDTSLWRVRVYFISFIWWYIMILDVGLDHSQSQSAKSKFQSSNWIIWDISSLIWSFICHLFILFAWKLIKLKIEALILFKRFKYRNFEQKFLDNGWNFFDFCQIIIIIRKIIVICCLISRLP